MLIDMLSTGASGGGAIAALRLHAGLHEHGVDCRFWHSPRHTGHDPGNTLRQVRPLRLTAKPTIGDRLQRLLCKQAKKRALRGRAKDLEIFTTPWSTPKTSYDSEQLNGDVLHLHWVNTWLDWPTFFASIPPGHPVVWTLHDMNPMTGGCHHADGCSAFHSHCGNCPQLGGRARGDHDLAFRGFEDKRRAYEGKVLHIVTPSRWLQNHAQQSRLFASATSIQTIYNGLDTSQFRPKDQAVARRELGLPAGKTIIAVGACSLKNRRKGLPELVAAVKRLANRDNLMCVGFGDNGDQLGAALDVEFRSTGYLETPQELSRVYSAADLFVVPSLGENMPQTMIESMACGTPVVAFDVGGIPEVIEPRVTGLLAPLRDVEALGRQIQWMVDHPERRREMGRRSRSKILLSFDLDQQTAKYLRLYQAVAGQRALRADPPRRKVA